MSIDQPFWMSEAAELPLIDIVEQEHPVEDTKTQPKTLAVDEELDELDVEPDTVFAFWKLY